MEWESAHPSGVFPLSILIIHWSRRANNSAKTARQPISLACWESAQKVAQILIESLHHVSMY